MQINKHKILQEYIQEFLEDNNLNFEAITMYPNYRAIVPTYGDYVLRTDITGAKYKEYTFAFVGVELYDQDNYSDINANNMGKFDDFIEWIEQKEKNKDYPDFGDNTSDYKIEPLQNMANLSMIDENTQTAKYVLACKVTYIEREQQKKSL